MKLTKWLKSLGQAQTPRARRTLLSVDGLQQRALPSCASLSGVVFIDCNNNGVKDCGEKGISGVKINLQGKTDCGQIVSAETTTDCSGNYSFTSLQAGTYTVKETQPCGLGDGKDTAGTGGGWAGNDIICGVRVDYCPVNGYNFGESCLPDNHQGSKSKGSNSKGSNSKGSKGKGDCSVGSKSKGSNSKGSKGKGDCSVGSKSKGSNSKGSKGKGDCSVGSKSKGSNSKGSKGKGDCSVGSKSKGSNSKGSKGKGDCSVGSKSKGSNSKGSKGKGDCSVGSKSKGSNSKGSKGKGNSKGSSGKGSSGKGNDCKVVVKKTNDCKK